MEEWESCPDNEHDWRIDPYVILLSYPPRQRLVCATCGDISSRPTASKSPYGIDPADWPKA